MKTHLTLPKRQTLKSIGLITVFMIAFLSFNTSYGQSTQEGRIIKGTISDGTNPIDGATIVLKGSKVGTASNEKGEFTFPQPLKNGDILLISYLGYKNQELKINEKTTSLEIVLTEDLIEFTGALNSNKPYKSKRSN